MENLTDRISRHVRDHDCSDIHIHSGAAPALRIHGNIERPQEEVVSSRALEIFVHRHLNENQYQRLEKNKSLDISIQCGETKFRANFYYTYGRLAIVLRKINDDIPTVHALGIPPQVVKSLNLKGGLALLSGPTGSGKSTSLAAITQCLLDQSPIHVVTIEDPIEYRFQHKRSLVSQRQIGADANSFDEALYAALREDPDVILLGEMRTPETIALALIAAELGHLVIGTLHAGNCTDAVARIVHAFGVNAADAEYVRMQLADALQLVISQQLLPRKSSPGRVAVFEVMLATVAVKNSIRSNRIFQLPSILETSKNEGMVTMQAFAEQLYQQGIIDRVET